MMARRAVVYQNEYCGQQGVSKAIDNRYGFIEGHNAVDGWYIVKAR